jgi:hypothetical protein
MDIVIASNSVHLPGMYNRRMAEQNTLRSLNQFVLLYLIKHERNEYVYLLTGPIDSERCNCISYTICMQI